MPRSGVVLASTVLALLAASNAPQPIAGLLSIATPAVAEDQPPAGADARPVDKLTVSRPTWHRGGGLLFAEATIRNANTYPVWNVIISCDFFDEWGASIGSKATALGRPVSPGRTRFSGLQFSLTKRNAQGGACRALSAERMSGSMNEN